MCLGLFGFKTDSYTIKKKKFCGQRSTMEGISHIILHKLFRNMAIV